MIDADLLELLESTVQIRPAGAVARDLSVTFGPPLYIQSHVEEGAHRIRMVSGEEIIAEGIVFLDDVYVAIDNRAELTLPGGKVANIVLVETTYGPNWDTGENGPFQTVLHIGG